MQPDTIMLLDLGNYIESKMIKFFRKAKKWFDLKYYQQSVELFRLIHPVTKKEVIIEGSTDSVFMSEKWQAVVDYKSKKDKFHHYMKSDWDATTEKLSRIATKINDRTFWVDDLPAFLAVLDDEFFAKNFKQVNGYCMSQFMQDRGVNHGVIIQYNKNDSRRREIRFRPSQVVFDEVKAKFQHILDAVHEHGADGVRRDYALGSISCAFCKFRETCWSQDAQQAFFKTLPKKKWPEDIDKLPFGHELADLLRRFELERDAAKRADKLEQEIGALLNNNGINKVRLDSNHIYELKPLKTKLAVRRSKL